MYTPPQICLTSPATQCYLTPDTSEFTPPNPCYKGWYSIYPPWRDGRLSWPRWLVIYQDGLLAHRQSPIQVLTGPDVELLRWSTPACYRKARPFGFLQTHVDNYLRRLRQFTEHCHGSRRMVDDYDLVKGTKLSPVGVWQCKTYLTVERRWLRGRYEWFEADMSAPGPIWVCGCRTCWRNTRCWRQSFSTPTMTKCLHITSAFSTPTTTSHDARHSRYYACLCIVRFGVWTQAVRSCFLSLKKAILDTLLFLIHFFREHPITLKYTSQHVFYQLLLL